MLQSKPRGFSGHCCSSADQCDCWAPSAGVLAGIVRRLVVSKSECDDTSGVIMLPCLQEILTHFSSRTALTFCDSKTVLCMISQSCLSRSTNSLLAFTPIIFFMMHFSEPTQLPGNVQIKSPQCD